MRTTKKDWGGLGDPTNNQINDFFILHLSEIKSEIRHLKVLRIRNLPKFCYKIWFIDNIILSKHFLIVSEGLHTRKIL